MAWSFWVSNLRLVYVADLHLPIWVRDPILAVALKWEVCFMDKYGFACFLQPNIEEFLSQKDQQAQVLSFPNSLPIHL